MWDKELIKQFKLVFTEFQENCPKHWIRYIRNNKGKPIGVVVMADINDSIVVSASLCRKTDEWNKHVGRFQAVNKISNYAGVIGGDFLPASDEIKLEAAEIDINVKYSNSTNLWTRQLPSSARSTTFELYNDVFQCVNN